MNICPSGRRQVSWNTRERWFSPKKLQRHSILSGSQQRVCTICLDKHFQIPGLFVMLYFSHLYWWRDMWGLSLLSHFLSFTHLLSYSFALVLCRWNVFRGRNTCSDPQPGWAAVHPSAGLWSFSGISNFCFLSGAKGITLIFLSVLLKLLRPGAPNHMKIYCPLKCKQH